mgnify:CR=1 FL=1
MWKLPTNQFTARLTATETEELNGIAETLQSENNVIFTSAKELLLFLARNRAENNVIEKEVPIEVERKLNENEHIIMFSPDQEEILTEIAKNRSEKSENEPLRNPVDQIKHMAFQKHVLENHWGNYFTGL